MFIPHSPLFQAVSFTWEWWWEHFSGAGCPTKSDEDSASSFACPPTASSPSCHLLSRDTAYSSFAVSLRASGKSDNVEVILGPTRIPSHQFKWFVKSQVKTSESPSFGWSEYIQYISKKSAPGISMSTELIYEWMVVSIGMVLIISPFFDIHQIIENWIFMFEYT